jgi:Fe-S-cluster containining protein
MSPQDQSPDPSPKDLRKQIAEGLLYAHTRLADNTSKTLESASFTYALVELLSEKGVISVEELDQHKRVIAERLASKNREKGIGVLLQQPEYDKYAYQPVVQIDCASLVPLCHSACCKLPFALSKQDVREGILHWDLGQPYVIAQGRLGYCSHLEEGSGRCSVWANRPVPCRAFDCRNDKRIWLDFESKTINPQILNPEWPNCIEQKGPPDPA